MGHEDEGAAAEAGAYALDEEGLRLGVEGGRRLIEQEDAARTEEAAGYGNALRLTLAEAGSALTAEGVEALGQVVDEVRDRRVEGLAHLVFSRVRLADEEVFADGSAYKCIALRHINDVAAGHRRGAYGLFVIIVLHLALVRKQEGEHETDQRALSYTCLSDDCRHGTRLEVIAESFDHIDSAVRIPEIHIREPYSKLACETHGLAFLFLRKIQLAQPVD